MWDMQRTETMYESLDEGCRPRRNLSRLSSSKAATQELLIWFWRRLPFLQWLPRYSFRDDLLSDVIGGCTIGMVCFAQTLAHAAIATTKPVQGPYCAFIPAIAYAFMGTSPHASVSSGAIAAIIISDQVRPWKSIEDRTHMASVLALVSGLTLLLVGLFNLSFAVRFLSRSTVSGFVTGGSVLIIAQQLKNLLGFHTLDECHQLGDPPECHAFPHTDHFVALVKALWLHLPQTDEKSLALGLLLMSALQIFSKTKTRSSRIIKEQTLQLQQQTASLNKKKQKEEEAEPEDQKESSESQRRLQSQHEDSQRRLRRAWLMKRLAEMKEIIVVLLAATLGYLTRAEDGRPIMATIGHIPPGLPAFHPPWDTAAFQGLLRDQVPLPLDFGSGEDAYEATRDWEDRPGLLRDFIVGGTLVAFTTFLTTFATAKRMAIKNNYHLDAAQEMIGLGSASIAGSFFGAFSPSGSLSRTGLADECGVRTQLGGIFCALIIGLGLYTLTPILEFLPKCTLGAIIIMSTKGMLDFGMPRRLWKYWRPQEDGGLKRDFIIWWIAFFFTIFTGVLQGIAIAVLFSVLLIVADAAAPQAVVLGRVPGSGGSRKWRNVDDWPESAVQYAGILVFEFRGPISFASAEWFQQCLEEKQLEQEKLLAEKVRFVIVSFQSVHHLDATGLAVLEELFSSWKRYNMECIIVEARHTVQYLIEEELDRRAKLVDRSAFMLDIDSAVATANRILEMERRRKSAPS